MKKKTLAAIALTSVMTVSAAFAGCSLKSTNSRLDMEQIIATVDISKSDKFDEEELNIYKAAVSPSDINKRELISYFINVGYSYVQNGMSYEDTFNSLVDSLVSNAVLVQYSTVELLKNADAATVEAFKNEKDEVAKYKLLLDDDKVNLATYSLYSSINSAIDNYEQRVIDEDEGYEGTATRTTPTNLGAEQDDYYPKTADGKLDYAIYTGYGDYTLENSGAYKDDALDGTTRSTRVKAYNSFLNNLRRNNLVDADKEAEKLTDVLALGYIQSELVSQLESQVIDAYYDLYEDEQEERLLNDNYIQNVYEEVLNSQKENYDKSASSFVSAMDGMSSTSFVLYSPDTSDSDWNSEYGEKFARYGFIYNILLPFSGTQTVELNSLKSAQTDNGDDDMYYVARNNILKNIKTEDQRSAWFNGTEDYSFVPEGGFDFYKGGKDYRKYLFFEDSLTDSEEGGRYKKLQAYDGRYSYNGHVVKNEDESYTLIPDKLDIDGMLTEFENYVEYVMGSDTVSYTKTAGYYDIEKFHKMDGDEEIKDEIDYSKFIYAEGRVDVGTYKSSSLMDPEAASYKAMSAVNELQFAYTTDTGILSNYVGYSLTAYDTSYIKEFEYAAKKAVGEGVGAFNVCAGDYGWHLIYVTHVFDMGETYGAQPDWANNIDKEGTFENAFFEWVKGSSLSDVSTTRRTQILNDFNKDTTVTKYQSRYQDLLDLGN